MTLRDVYEAVLIELNKVQAPSLLVKDFVYLYNKATQEYFNKRYNLFEVNQQLTDDLRVLTKTVKLFPVKETGDVFGQSYRCDLPFNYVHILNCICEFEDRKPTKACDDGSTVFQQGANKLDTNQWSSVINNYYMRPSVKQPYYYIINIQDPNKAGIADSVKMNDVLNGTEKRYGNSVQPTMQIKCGNDLRYDLRCIYVDYLRAPEYLSLDQDILDKVTDNSQVVEFPDYVIYEIINQIVALVMENTQNPRVQTFPQISMSVPQK